MGGKTMLKVLALLQSVFLLAMIYMIIAIGLAL